MTFKHEFKIFDISGNQYYEITNGDFTGQFRVINGTYLIAHMMTLRNAPSGWVDAASEYIESETEYEVI